jgi:hypothetical protein
MQEEGIVNVPGLSAWPALLGFCWALVVRAFASCYVADHAAR